MGALALEKTIEPHQEKMISYLSSDGGYWLKNDKWNADSAAYKSLNLGPLKDGIHTMADFSGYKNENIKIEVKWLFGDDCGLKIHPNPFAMPI